MTFATPYSIRTRAVRKCVSSKIQPLKKTELQALFQMNLRKKCNILQTTLDLSKPKQNPPTTPPPLSPITSRHHKSNNVKKIWGLGNSKKNTVIRFAKFSLIKL